MNKFYCYLSMAEYSVSPSEDRTAIVHYQTLGVCKDTIFSCFDMYSLQFRAHSPYNNNIIRYLILSGFLAIKSFHP